MKSTTDHSKSLSLRDSQWLKVAMQEHRKLLEELAEWTIQIERGRQGIFLCAREMYQNIESYGKILKSEQAKQLAETGWSSEVDLADQIEVFEVIFRQKIMERKATAASILEDTWKQYLKTVKHDQTYIGRNLDLMDHELRREIETTDQEFRTKILEVPEENREVMLLARDRERETTFMKRHNDMRDYIIQYQKANLLVISDKKTF